MFFGSKQIIAQGKRVTINNEVLDNADTYVQDCKGHLKDFFRFAVSLKLVDVACFQPSRLRDAESTPT